MISGVHINSEDAAYFSILFDIGGIIGGIVAGLATDYTGKSATTCAVMLIGAIPVVSTCSSHGHWNKYRDQNYSRFNC